MRKGISPFISYLLYVGVGLAVVSIVATVGMNTVNSLQDTSSIDSMRSSLQSVGETIDAVARGGRGTQMPIEFQIRRGSLEYENQSLLYRIITPADIISAGTRQDFGNIGIASNADVQLFEGTYNGTACYRLRNEHLETCIKKQATFQNGSVQEMFMFMDGTEIDRDEDPSINISINGDDAYTHGMIRTRPVQTGMTLEDAAVLIDVKPDDRPGYTIRYSVRSGADFYQLQVE